MMQKVFLRGSRGLVRQANRFVSQVNKPYNETSWEVTQPPAVGSWPDSKLRALPKSINFRPP